MKHLRLFLVCVATFALMGCSAVQVATGGDMVAQATGRNAGLAVQGLYNAYKNTGTIDLTNTNNLNNALNLAAAYTNLKSNKDSEGYRKAFTNGLIASSAGLITSANATAFVDKLLASSGLSNVNVQNVTQTAATVAAIVTLLNTLRK